MVTCFHAIFTDGIDFFGPTPSILTFTSGKTNGDTLCADVMIADGPVPKRQRKFSISISAVEGSEGASVDPNRDTATIVIATNFDDCKIYLNYQSPWCACVSHTGIEFRFAQPFIEVTESQDAVAHVCVEAVSLALSINVTVHLNSIPLGESKLKLYKNDCCIHRILLQKILLLLMRTLRIWMLQ